MPFEFSFTWQDKDYKAVASRYRKNGVPVWKVAFPSGRYYEFLWDGRWSHLEHYERQMPPELKNKICRALERHPAYRAEMT